MLQSRLFAQYALIYQEVHLASSLIDVEGGGRFQRYYGRV